MWGHPQPEQPDQRLHEPLTDEQLARVRGGTIELEVFSDGRIAAFARVGGARGTVAYGRTPKLALEALDALTA